MIAHAFKLHRGTQRVEKINKSQTALACTIKLTSSIASAGWLEKETALSEMRQRPSHFYLFEYITGPNHQPKKARNIFLG